MLSAPFRWVIHRASFGYRRLFRLALVIHDSFLWRVDLRIRNWPSKIKAADQSPFPVSNANENVYMEPSPKMLLPPLEHRFFLSPLPVGREKHERIVDQADQESDWKCQADQHE